MSIKGLVWDMGGIIYQTPFEIFGEIERERGWPEGTLPRGPFDPSSDDLFELLATNQVTEREYFLRWQERLARRGYPIDIKRTIVWRGRTRPEVMEAVERLGRDYAQVTLSNDSAEWLGLGWWDHWEYRHLFAALVDVVTLGVRKPHPRTYLVAAERINLRPEECLFIDDLHPNLVGAEQVGMKAIWFDVTAPGESVDRLYRFLAADKKVTEPPR